MTVRHVRWARGFSPLTFHFSPLTVRTSCKLVLTRKVRSYSDVFAAFISLPASSAMLHCGNPLATKKSSERLGK
jgi:hypothetical protein